MTSDQKDIFLSYRSIDGKEYADKLHNALLERGFKVWFDDVTILTGDELDNRISDVISNIGLYVAIVTNGFCDPDSFAFKEFQLAVNVQNDRHLSERQKYYVFPILHGLSDAKQLPEESKIKDYLKNHHYSKSTEEFSKIVDTILMRYGVVEDEFVGKRTNKIRMARFPVTNVEYKRFINDGGYTNSGVRKWWSEAGKEFWLHYATRRPHKYFGSKDRGASIRTEDESITRNITASNELFNGFNQPVTGISYFEAEAYCRWLNDTGKISGKVRLPTEEEWLKSALHSNADKYPWGVNDPYAKQINIIKKKDYSKIDLTLDTVDFEEISKINFPSRLGAFPKGVSHIGCHDMYGNVWEWLGDLQTEEDAINKAEGDNSNIGKIAGYCCFDSLDRIKDRPPIAYRRPGYRHHVIGFRIALEENTV
jgi:formylglycine-generating enzyme required for sulfatase activity